MKSGNRSQQGWQVRAVVQALSIVCLTGLGMLPNSIKPEVAQGAERLLLRAGPLKLALSLDSLQTFAETGEIDRELQFYARIAGDRAMAQLRQALQRRFKVSHVVVSRLTYSPLGEESLEALGEVIQTEAGINGFYALRSAWILSAENPEGFTLIDLMRRYPARGIQFNVERIVRVQQLLTALSGYTDTTVTAIAQQAEREANAIPTTDFSRLPDPQKPGPFSFTKRTLQLQRQTQTIEGAPTKRAFYVDLYLPEGQSKPAPITVVSHGLGSSPGAFAYLGEHLASHGFAVAIPQHIGSGEQQFEALLTGLTSSNVTLTEFVERPLDVKQTLNELEQLSQTALAGKLDLQRVGIMGHSFGGYTTLVNAGAPLNLNRLFAQCPSAIRLNLSVSLQCLNQVLPFFDTSILSDSRIKAAIAINPLTSLVFGPESMGAVKVPTMLIGGTKDILTPLVPEQVHPFLWLQTPDKYLVNVDPCGHTAVDATDGDVNPITGSLGEVLSGPEPVITRQYVRALSLVFMQTYIGDRPEYRSYLNAAYARSITRSPLRLDLVNSLTPQQLEQAYGGPPPIPFVPAPVPNAIGPVATPR